MYITSRQLKTMIKEGYIHGDITMNKVNDANNEESNAIGRYETDIKEQTVRIKSRQVMINDRMKPTKMMKKKTDFH